jgi:hypothetical protein
MVLPLTATGRPEVAGGLSLLVLFALTPQVLPLEEEGNPVKMPAEAFNVRLEEPTVIDMAFLATSGGTSAAAGSSAAAAAGAKPVLALLYEDSKQARHIKTYTLNLKTRVRCREACRCPLSLCVMHMMVLALQLTRATAVGI